MEFLAVRHNFERGPPKPNLIQFGSVLSGEDLNVKAYQVRQQMPSDSKSLHGFWQGELIKGIYNLR